MPVIEKKNEKEEDVNGCEPEADTDEEDPASPPVSAQTPLTTETKQTQQTKEGPNKSALVAASAAASAAASTVPATTAPTVVPQAMTASTPTPTPAATPSLLEEFFATPVPTAVPQASQTKQTASIDDLISGLFTPTPAQPPQQMQTLFAPAPQLFAAGPQLFASAQVPAQQQLFAPVPTQPLAQQQQLFTPVQVPTQPSSPLQFGQAPFQPVPVPAVTASVSPPTQGTEYPSMTVFDKQGVKVIFACSRKLGSPHILSITASFYNSLNVNVTAFDFQVSVPKYIKLTMLGASGNVLGPAGSTLPTVTQTLHLENTAHGQKRLLIRVRIDYQVNGQHLSEQAQIDNLP